MSKTDTSAINLSTSYDLTDSSLEPICSYKRTNCDRCLDSSFFCRLDIGSRLEHEPNLLSDPRETRKKPTIWDNLNNKPLRLVAPGRSHSMCLISTTFRTSLVRAHTAWSGEFFCVRVRMRACMLDLVELIADTIGLFFSQLCFAQAVWTESCDQEDHSLRSLHVLLAYVTRNEIATILQSRKHHLHSRHPEAAKL